ncbi:TonB-dependent receptor [Sulfuriroseicoccus oceanibius]|uniref:TonB-dependent receptor n=1 Tax=Sulfuriroseicoccus oceanibius TaxID=2707525 RepID=A0A6B3L885_9BACT|nr:TonB-dependent receptor [Sulfuriroseicoccus oceanibius]QQL45946.1 TonB-dependent receptor [Sulfuriroseicoccus oceanibius]
MRSPKPAKVLAALVPALCLLNGLAAEQPEVTSAPVPPAVTVEDLAATEGALDPLVVTATRESRNLSELPNSVEVLGVKQLKERQTRTFPEAFFETPGVLMQKTAHGQGSPYIRGFTGYQTLALIDGIRLNNSTFRSGPNQYWNTIDPLSLSSIEIVKGQGSVLYGSDAIGGTVNALTIRPEYAEDGTTQSFGRILGRYASAERSVVGRVEGGVSRGGDFGVVAGVSVKEFGDLEVAGLGRQEKTGYSEIDGDVKLEKFLASGARLTFAHQQVHQDNAWRTHKTVRGESWRGTSVGDELSRILDQDRYLTYVQAEGSVDGSWADGYLLSLSHQRHEEFQDRVRSDGRRDEQGFTVDTMGVFGQFNKEGTAIGDLAYGASYYLDWIDSFRKDFNADGSFKGNAVQGPVGDNSKYHLAGAYVQTHLEPAERLDVWIGGRVSYAQADIGRVADPNTGDPIGFSKDWWDVSGSVRFAYALDGEETWRLYGGVSQGFRAPSLADLSQFASARTDEIATPSLGLDPEKFVSTELGVRHSGERFNGGLVYYYTFMDDLITGQRTGRVVDGFNEVTKQNARDGFVHGVELSSRYQLCDAFSVFGWVAWQEGETEDAAVAGQPITSQTITRMLPLSGQLGVRWDSPERRIWVELLGQGADKQDRLSFGDQKDTQRIPPGGTPGYVLGTVRGGWHVTENVTLVAAVENFTDEEYRVHGSGVNGAGRNFVVSGEWRF